MNNTKQQLIPLNNIELRDITLRIFKQRNNKYKI